MRPVQIVISRRNGKIVVETNSLEDKRPGARQIMFRTQETACDTAVEAAGLVITLLEETIVQEFDRFKL